MAGEQQPEKAMGQMVQEALSSVPQGSYTILLSHRPELMAVYVENEVDLVFVFSGHAHGGHGGQIRLPGLGGLRLLQAAPGQGWFPRYTSGEHQEGKTTMIISRGLGNSLFPYRIFNRPEIIAVTLKTI